MDILELGAIGELVGGVAVIATVGYLSVQIRHGNRQASTQAIKEAIREFKKSLRHNNEDAATHYYLALVYDRMHMGVDAIKHMLEAEKYFKVAGKDFWKKRSRETIDLYYYFYSLKKEEFEK